MSKENQPEPVRVRVSYVSCLSKNFSNKQLLLKNRLFIQAALPAYWSRYDDPYTLLSFKIYLRYAGMTPEEPPDLEYILLMLWLAEIGLAELDQTKRLIRRKT